MDLFKHAKKNVELAEKLLDCSKEITELREENERYEKVLKELRADHAHENYLRAQKETTLVDIALKQQSTEMEKLRTENGIQKAKIDILEQAFKNLGFDVKDMKDILNKLVDGLIAKNEIKLVK